MCAFCIPIPFSCSGCAYIAELLYPFPSSIHASSIPFSTYECLTYLPTKPNLPLTPPNSSSVSPHNANLLSAPQLSDDGSPSRPQLPTELDGSSPNNPSLKGKEAVPTFSGAVKLGVGSISGGSVSRTRTECHVYPATSNLESMHKATPIRPLTPNIDLPTMSLFGKIWGIPFPSILFVLKLQGIGLRLRGKLIMWIWVLVGYYLSSLMCMIGNLFGLIGLDL